MGPPIIFQCELCNSFCTTKEAIQMHTASLIHLAKQREVDSKKEKDAKKTSGIKIDEAHVWCKPLKVVVPRVNASACSTGINDKEKPKSNDSNASTKKTEVKSSSSGETKPKDDKSRTGSRISKSLKNESSANKSLKPNKFDKKETTKSNKSACDVQDDSVKTSSSKVRPDRNSRSDDSDDDLHSFLDGNAILVDEVCEDDNYSTVSVDSNNAVKLEKEEKIVPRSKVSRHGDKLTRPGPSSFKAVNKEIEKTACEEKSVKTSFNNSTTIDVGKKLPNPTVIRSKPGPRSSKVSVKKKLKPSSSDEALENSAPEIKLPVDKSSENKTNIELCSEGDAQDDTMRVLDNNEWEVTDEIGDQNKHDAVDEQSCANTTYKDDDKDNGVKNEDKSHNRSKLGVGPVAGEFVSSPKSEETKVQNDNEILSQDDNLKGFDGPGLSNADITKSLSVINDNMSDEMDEMEDAALDASICTAIDRIEKYIEDGPDDDDDFGETFLDSKLTNPGEPSEKMELKQLIKEEHHIDGKEGDRPADKVPTTELKAKQESEVSVFDKVSEDGFPSDLDISGDESEQIKVTKAESEKSTDGKPDKTKKTSIKTLQDSLAEKSKPVKEETKDKPKVDTKLDTKLVNDPAKHMSDCKNTNTLKLKKLNSKQLSELCKTRKVVVVLRRLNPAHFTRWIKPKATVRYSSLIRGSWLERELTRIKKKRKEATMLISSSGKKPLLEKSSTGRSASPFSHKKHSLKPISKHSDKDQRRSSEYERKRSTSSSSHKISKVEEAKLKGVVLKKDAGNKEEKESNHREMARAMNEKITGQLAKFRIPKKADLMVGNSSADVLGPLLGFVEKDASKQRGKIRRPQTGDERSGKEDLKRHSPPRKQAKYDGEPASSGASRDGGSTRDKEYLREAQFGKKRENIRDRSPRRSPAARRLPGPRRSPSFRRSPSRRRSPRPRTPTSPRRSPIEEFLKNVNINKPPRDIVKELLFPELARAESESNIRSDGTPPTNSFHGNPKHGGYSNSYNRGRGRGYDRGRDNYNRGGPPRFRSNCRSNEGRFERNFRDKDWKDFRHQPDFNERKDTGPAAGLSSAVADMVKLIAGGGSGAMENMLTRVLALQQVLSTASVRPSSSNASPPPSGRPQRTPSPSPSMPMDSEYALYNPLVEETKMMHVPIETPLYNEVPIHDRNPMQMAEPQPVPAPVPASTPAPVPAPAPIPITATVPSIVSASVEPCVSQPSVSQPPQPSLESETELQPSSPPTAEKSTARELMATLDDEQKQQIAKQLAGVLTVTGHSEVSEELLQRLVQHAIITKAQALSKTQSRRGNQSKIQETALAAKSSNPWSENSSRKPEPATSPAPSTSTWEQPPTPAYDADDARPYTPSGDVVDSQASCKRMSAGNSRDTTYPSATSHSSASHRGPYDTTSSTGLGHNVSVWQDPVDMVQNYPPSSVPSSEFPPSYNYTNVDQYQHASSLYGGYQQPVAISPYSLYNQGQTTHAQPGNQNLQANSYPTVEQQNYVDYPQMQPTYGQVDYQYGSSYGQQHHY